MINPPLFRLVDMSRRSIIANRNLTNHLWGRTFKNGGLPSKVVQKLGQQMAMISNDADSFSSALWSVSSNKIFLPENDLEDDPAWARDHSKRASVFAGSSMFQHIQWLNDEATVEETGHATAAAVLPMFLGETPSKLIMLSFFWPKTGLGKR